MSVLSWAKNGLPGKMGTGWIRIGSNRQQQNRDALSASRLSIELGGYYGVAVKLQALFSFLPPISPETRRFHAEPFPETPSAVAWMPVMSDPDKHKINQNKQPGKTYVSPRFEHGSGGERQASKVFDSTVNYRFDVEKGKVVLHEPTATVPACC